jgi:nucleoside-diphosphate-sugar epimerase
MIIAISGTHGFIGQALLRYFTRAGHQVVSFNARPGFINFEIRQLTVTRPQVIIHCAAYGNHYHHKFNHQTLEANTVVPFSLLQLAGVLSARFIYFSTTSLLPQMPVTLYSATKQAGELLCKAFRTQAGTDAVIVRPSSVTGPGEQDHHLIPTLIRSCLHGAPMRFDPKPTHDFIDIADVCTAVETIIHHGRPGPTYNISSGTTYTNRSVKELVEELTGMPATITEEVARMRIYDTDHWWVDNWYTRALGWKPAFTLQDSVLRSIESQTVRA